MLRFVLLVLGGLLVVFALAYRHWGLLAFAAPITLLIGAERWRYGDPVSTPPAGSEDTGERFIDPDLGREVRVFYDPRTGKRSYVSDTTRSTD